MFKAFSILWLMVFLPISFLIFSYGYSPVWMIADGVQSHIIEGQEEGVFYLLEKELSALPEEQWVETIAQIATHFSYNLELQTLAEASAESERKSELQRGEFVFIEGVPNVIKRRITGTDWVISKALDMDEEETYLRSVQGGAYLILKQFRESPKEQWPAVLEELDRHSSHQFAIKNDEELTLTQIEWERLNSQQIVWRFAGDGQYEFLRRLPDDDRVFRALTPAYAGVQLGLYIALFVTFITSVSVCMLIWVYPVWRDLKKLSLTAKAFGNGALEKRAKPSRASVVADLSSSFNSMADNIQELITGQRDLTNAIAHDLRTPLYRLKFALEMLEDTELSDTEKNHYRQCVDISVEDLDHLINQTLILSRYRRLTDLNQFSDVVFAEVIDKEAQQFRLQHPNLSLDVDIDEQLAREKIYADPNALTRVMTNLLSNASRFARNHIRIQFHRVNDNYLLTVEDDGPGIDEKYWDSLFKPFTQVENQHRDNAHGHGLGLAIVSQIAQWHKGMVSVSQSELKGAFFTVSWPVSLGQQA